MTELVVVDGVGAEGMVEAGLVEDLPHVSGLVGERRLLLRLLLDLHAAGGQAVDHQTARLGPQVQTFL